MTEEAKEKTEEATEHTPAAEEVDPQTSSLEDEPAAADTAADEATEDAAPEDQVAKACAEAADWQDKFMRLHAEWDTYRRRTNEQRAEEKKRATEKLVEDLIPVLDDFERSVDFAEKNGEEGLLEGVQKVHAKFVDALLKHGVEVIDPVGEEFNALEARAVATVENADVPDETVEEVYQKGYKMGIKVIRSAMVTVAVGGPKREKPETDGD